jgi:hypothetical protein
MKYCVHNRRWQGGPMAHRSPSDQRQLLIQYDTCQPTTTTSSKKEAPIKILRALLYALHACFLAVCTAICACPPWDDPNLLPVGSTGRASNPSHLIFLQLKVIIHVRASYPHTGTVLKGVSECKINPTQSQSTGTVFPSCLSRPSKLLTQIQQASRF